MYLCIEEMTIVIECRSDCTIGSEMDEFAIKQTTIVIYFLSETHIPGDIVFFGYPVTIGADAIATQR